MDDYIYVWPDGEYCYRDKLAHYLDRKPGIPYECVSEEEFYSEELDILCDELFGL